jgi:hypothetical protein
MEHKYLYRNIYQYITKALEHYDDMYIDYSSYNNNKYNINKSDDTITLYDRKDNPSEMKYQILGLFDSTESTWNWAYALQIPSKYKSISDGLLKYAINLDNDNDTESHLYIKSILLNSVIKLTDYVQLETILAISAYLLKERIKFIYPVKEYIDKERKSENYIETYYIIYKMDE